MTEKTNLLETIMTRKSIRDFKNGDISPQDLQKILQAATMAPSAGNGQPWRFHIIKGKTKQTFTEALHTSKNLPQTWKALFYQIANTVPIIIAVENPAICTESLNEFKDRFGLKNAQQAIVVSAMGTAASIENMLLAIHSLGYGSVWMALPPVLEAAKKATGIRGELCGVIAVGCPADEQNDYVNRTRKSVEQVTKYYE